MLGLGSSLLGCPDRTHPKNEFFCASLPCTTDAAPIADVPGALDAGEADADNGDVEIADGDPPDTGAGDGGPFDVGPIDAGPPVCGNGVVDGNDTCDDGNTDSGDGCDNMCIVEPGFECFDPGEACILWYHDSKARIPIVVTARGSALDEGFSVAFEIDHAQLVTDLEIDPDGDDFRVVQVKDNGDYEQLHRVIEPGSGWNRSQTTIWFALTAPLAAGAVETKYAVFVGLQSGGGGLREDPTKVFRFHDDFEGADLSEWTTTVGLEPTLTDDPGTFEPNRAMLARNDPNSEDNVEVRKSLVSFEHGEDSGPTARRYSTWIYLPPIFTSTASSQNAILAQICGASCNDVDQLARISVNRGTRMLAYRLGTANTVSLQVQIPSQTWTRFDYSIATNGAMAEFTLRVGRTTFIQSNFTPSHPTLDTLQVGLFWVPSGLAEVLVDNHFERDYALVDPLTTTGPLQVASPQ